MRILLKQLIFNDIIPTALIPDPRPIPGAKGSNRQAWRFRGQAAEKASVFQAGNRLETGLPILRILEGSRQDSDARAVGISG